MIFRSAYFYFLQEALQSCKLEDKKAANEWAVAQWNSMNQAEKHEYFRMEAVDQNRYLEVF